jgi:CRP-like cAMP-binding protein
MMSMIGSMVSQMDREAQLKEERMDAVKEWMASRNFPHKLFVRVRKYYEHYYAQKTAFNEEEMVDMLTPTLKKEVTGVLLRDSLGHFPLFAVLGTEFQQAVYPRLKPLSYATLDVIYSKGDASNDIFFLRRGTVDVLAAGFGSEVLYRITQGQYFGEEVLTHQRRGCTVLSNGITEMWSLSQQVLEEAIEKMPELIPKLEEFVVTELERKRRLYALSYRILIGCAIDGERRAALIVQKAWTNFASMRAKGGSYFAPSSPFHTGGSGGSGGDSGGGSSGGGSGSGGSVREAVVGSMSAQQSMQAQLRDVADILEQIRRKVDAPGGAAPGSNRQLKA